MLSYLKIFFLFILSFTNNTTFSQTLINIDHRQMSVEPRGLIGHFELDFDANNTASTQEETKNFLGLKSGADISYYSEKHHYFLKGHLSFFELEEEEVQNQSYTHLRTNLFYQKRIAPEFYIQGQYDELRRLDLRALGGGGLRFILHHDEDIEIDAGTGLMYEVEKWQIEEQDRQIEKHLLKNSTYISAHKSFGKNGLSFHNLYQWGYDPDINAIRHRLSGDIRFQTEISRVVDLVVHVSLSYDARPIVPNKVFVYGISNALRFSFGRKKKEGEHE